LSPGERPDPAETLRRIETPTQKTCEDVAALMGVALQRTVKSVALMGAGGGSGDGDAAQGGQFVLALVRGDHVINEIKLAKLPGLADYRLATEAEIAQHLGSETGFLGPHMADSANPAHTSAIRVIADRSVAAMADFVVGANEQGFHLAGVNWGRDLPEPESIADIRNIVEGDASPDGRGTLAIARGIEVGHVFQLGRTYARAMKCTVLDENGKAATPSMGCYGIGVSRIVAAAIEQNYDGNGIAWPDAMAPWLAVVCVINPKKDAAVADAADALYRELNAAGIETALDDRGLRPGAMFADMELIGIPHRIVVSERGLATGSFEYRHRRASESENLDRPALFGRLGVAG